MTISRCCNIIAIAKGWRPQLGECRLWLGYCLENAGCDMAAVRRMQVVYWLLSGESRLYIGCCLENAGCDLAAVWRMQAVTWLLSGECRL